MIATADRLDTVQTELAQQHAEVLKRYMAERLATRPALAKHLPVDQNNLRTAGVVEWGEANFFIPNMNGTGAPQLIRFMPHQKTIMELFFNPEIAQLLIGASNFQTLVYSTVKKSGKTAIAALIARWITETWGSHAEVYALANDLEQARGRIYAAALASIELDPRYTRADKGIADLWRIIEREAVFLPSHSKLKAVSSDYKGEAGSNPTATLWSELWGYSSEASRRLWDELTPVPTRPRSIRYIETYAGYDNESGILNDLEDRLKDTDSGSRKLTRDELTWLGLDWPFDDKDEDLPFYIHAQSRTIAYWDSGERARRMPWQTPEYYNAQAAELRPSAFDRLHKNIRVSAAGEFIPVEWWDRLADPNLPRLDKDTPVVIGVDASVSGDCTGLVVVSRDPKDSTNVALRQSYVWEPIAGHPLDYSKTIEPLVLYLCTGHVHWPDVDHDAYNNSLGTLGKLRCPGEKPYNVMDLVYDQYQMHDLTTRLKNAGVVHCRPFSQQGERMIADKALYDLIRDQRITHDGNKDVREHLRNCAAKIPPDDNTKLRLVKKGDKSKIDLAVCLSMAANECLRLMLG